MRGNIRRCGSTASTGRCGKHRAVRQRLAAGKSRVWPPASLTAPPQSVTSRRRVIRARRSGSSVIIGAESSAEIAYTPDRPSRVRPISAIMASVTAPTQ